MLGERSVFEGRYAATEINVQKLGTGALINKLEDVQDALAQDYNNITTPANYDLLYSVARNLGSVEETAQTALFKALKTGIDVVRRQAEKFLAAKVPVSNEVYKTECSAFIAPLNMLAYVSNVAIISGEKVEIERERAKVKGRGVKKEKASTEGWSCGGNLKEKFLLSVLDLLDLELGRLWGLSVPEAEFCLLWTKVVRAMMENPANLKSRTVKANIFMLVARLVQRYDQHNHIAQVINEQLYNYKHVAAPFASLLQDLNNKPEPATNRLVGDVIRDLGRADLEALSKDSNAAKTFSEFLSSLAGVMPKVILQNVSIFMPHLDADNYLIRNGVLEAFGQLVLKAFDGAENKDEITKTRVELMKHLQERLRDSNAFTRARALETWATLVEQRVVPMNLLVELTEQTVRRLNDKGALVRKNALRLLTAILRYNSFCPILNLTMLRAKHAEVVARLAAAHQKFVVGTNAQQQQQQQQQPAGGDAEDDGGVRPMEDKENQGDDAPAAANASTAAAAQIQAQNVQKDVLEHEFYENTIRFAQLMDGGAHHMCKLLASKNKTDLQEVIKFFTTAKEFHLGSAVEGFRRMLLLLWSEEESVRNDVVAAYKESYLTVDVPDREPNKERYVSFQVARNLIGLTDGSSLSQLTALEKLVIELVKTDELHEGVVDALWTIFSNTSGPNYMQESRGAIALLAMIASARPETIRDNIDKIGRIGLVDLNRWHSDPIFARNVCLALQRMFGEGIVVDTNTKYPAEHPIFSKLTDLLEAPGGTASSWCQSAEQVVNVVYVLCRTPHVVLEPVVKRMASSAFSSFEEGVSVDSMSRVLFLAGHVALKELLQIEMIKHKQKERAKRLEKAEAAAAVGEKDRLEEDLGVEAQDAAFEEDYLNSLPDMLVCRNLLGLFGNVMQAILLKPDVYTSRILRAVASLSLSKFMVTSPKFCKDNLPLLFQVLDQEDDEAIRSNIVIALGDLSYRFPNLVEPWNASLYGRMQDKSPVVRKTTIMVLSHLILNGVIKIKNNGGLLALAVIDRNPRIAEFSKQFFVRLSSTDRGIYNALPDIVSYLSTRSPRLEESDFRQIVQFIFGFISSEKETQSLIEKLCHRFTTTSQLQQWRDIACCLSMLNFSEGGVKKLYACVQTFKELCYDETVYLYFQEMINKAKKEKGAKGGAQQQIAELQKVIDDCYLKHHPNADLPTGDPEGPKRRGRKGAAAAAAAGEGGAADNSSKPKRKRGGKRGKRAAADDDDDDDMDDLDDESSSIEEEKVDDVVVASAASQSAPGGMEEVAVVPSSAVKSKPKPKKGGRKPAAAVESPRRKVPAAKRKPTVVDVDEIAETQPNAAAGGRRGRPARAAAARKPPARVVIDDDDDDIFDDDEDEEAEKELSISSE